MLLHTRQRTDVRIFNFICLASPPFHIQYWLDFSRSLSAGSFLKTAAGYWARLHAMLKTGNSSWVLTLFLVWRTWGPVTPWKYVSAFSVNFRWKIRIIRCITPVSQGLWSTVVKNVYPTRPLSPFQSDIATLTPGITTGTLLHCCTARHWVWES